MLDDVHQCVFEHHLRRRRLVEPLLRIVLVADVLDAQHSVRVPHIRRRDRLAQDGDQFGSIGLVQNIAWPIGEVAVERDAALRLQAEDRFERRVIGIGVSVAIAIGGGAHVAAFARQPGPAALGRGDHGVENAERVEHAVIVIDLAHATAFAQIERDGAAVAEAVEHRHHHRAFCWGQRARPRRNTRRDCRDAACRSVPPARLSRAGGRYGRAARLPRSKSRRLNSGVD